jgi:hypothetical protein
MKILNHLQVVFSALPQEYEISFSHHAVSLSFFEQLAIAIGLAVTSGIVDSVSKAYNNKHPDLDAQSPEVLLVGFRAAGWTCFASTLLCIIVVILGLRDLGIIGKKTRASKDAAKSDNGTSKSGQSDPKSLK